jgi:hypothetical protein
VPLPSEAEEGFRSDISMKELLKRERVVAMSLHGASPAVSLALLNSIGGSFDRKFFIPSGLLPNCCKRYVISTVASRGVLNQTFE